MKKRVLLVDDEADVVDLIGYNPQKEGYDIAIAKHIVEAHGGTLLVTSEVVKGSTFSINVKR